MIISDRLIEASNEYKKRFGYGFPFMDMQGSSEDEIIEAIMKCLQEDKRFDSNVPDDAIV